jgi:imidazolonepropionase-like amidohydrolase
MRQQLKEGADFIKIYETGADSVREGKLSTPFQYTEPQLEAAVKEAARLGKHVAVHATGEPGTLYAAQAGVVSIDHADQLSDETMRLMKEKQIFAVPTFSIFEYFAEHAAGSDVGPFPHGTQARELVLLVKYGMSSLAVLQADLLNGAKLLGWQGQIGSLEPGYLADVIAITGNPLEDISAVNHVAFVMKAGIVYKQEGAVPKTEKAQQIPRKPCIIARDFHEQEVLGIEF